MNPNGGGQGIPKCIESLLFFISFFGLIARCIVLGLLGVGDCRSVFEYREAQFARDDSTACEILSLFTDYAKGCTVSSALSEMAFVIRGRHKPSPFAQNGPSDGLWILRMKYRDSVPRGILSVQWTRHDVDHSEPKIEVGFPSCRAAGPGMEL